MGCKKGNIENAVSHRKNETSYVSHNISLGSTQVDVGKIHNKVLTEYFDRHGFSESELTLNGAKDMVKDVLEIFRDSLYFDLEELT